MSKTSFSRLYLLFSLYSIALLPSSMPTLKQWHELTKNCDPIAADFVSIVPYRVFVDTLTAYMSAQKKFLDQATWLGTPLDTNSPELAKFSYESYKPITPTVFKLIAPTNSSFYFWGDLHGDIRALVQSLEELVTLGVLNDNLEIIDAHAYLFFLGDFTDRGNYATEVLTLLAHIASKKLNQGHIFLIRGNHEDIRVNSSYRFMEELEAKFDMEFKQNANAKYGLCKVLTQFYNLMPVAGFVGSGDEVVQCCHGGIEPGYDPIPLLDNESNFLYQYIQHLSPYEELTDQNNLAERFKLLDITAGCMGFWKDIIAPFITAANVGFMWSDFNGHASAPQFTTHAHQRGIMYGETLTDFILRKYSAGSKRVRAFIRGHQHNETLPGILDKKNANVFPMWNNKVITTVATSQFGTNHMAFIGFKTAATYENWIFSRYSKKMLEPVLDTKIHKKRRTRSRK